MKNVWNQPEAISRLDLNTHENKRKYNSMLALAELTLGHLDLNKQENNLFDPRSFRPKQMKTSSHRLSVQFRKQI